MIKVPTPLQRLHHTLLEEKGITLYVKRDDLTHPEVMGNKWRKLKYNVRQAQDQNLTTLITMGGAFSNHIAATAAAAKHAGLKSIGIIRGDELNSKSNPTLQFASARGMELRFVPREAFRNLRQNPDKLKMSNPQAYFLPEGGTNELAIQGCKEIIQEIEDDFDLIVCPIGTGGTFCGLAACITSKQQLLGISALKGGFIQTEVNQLAHSYGISLRNCTINGDYHHGGYAKTTPQLIDFINWFKENFDIQLDPVYTGKSFFGVWDMVKKNKFEKNLRIVLLHTGGLQGIAGYNQRNENIIQ